MSDDPKPSLPPGLPGTDATRVQKRPAARDRWPVNFPELPEPTTMQWATLIGRALVRWLQDTGVSIALACFPLMVLAIISWFPAVGHSAALRVVPLVALALYLLWLSCGPLRAASGRPPLGPFARLTLHWYLYLRDSERVNMRLRVALFCLPALTVLAVRAPLPGWLLAGLTVLPILVFLILAVIARLLEGLAIVCVSPVSELPDRTAPTNKSEPTRL